jgi:hypothetical protein
VDFLDQWWPRVVAVDPQLSVTTTILLGGLGLVLVLAAWRWVRVLATVCHEAGHAVVAVLTGRRLRGIRVHADTSGLTLTRGRPGGPGMVATLLAGYPAASFVGLGVAALAGRGRSALALWLIVVLLAAMLLWIRNLYGAFIVPALGALVAAVSWYAPAPVLSWVAHGVAWLLLFAGPRPVMEVARNRDPRTDAAQLRALTRVPRVVWVGLWLLVTVGALLWGAVLLVPGLAVR